MANAPGSTRRRLTVDQHQLAQLVRGEYSDPHRLLGVHGTTVRAFRPGAKEMAILLPDGGRVGMEEIHSGGVFEGELPSEDLARTYKLLAEYGTGPGFLYDDPYKAWPTLGELDLYLFGEGRHRALWKVLGAHRRCHEGVDGTS